MNRVQQAAPLRRLKWTAAALALFALPAAAEAQGFFFLFGNPSPYEIERRLNASGYAVNGPLVLRGDVYLADVVAPGEGPERLVIDARSGRVLERYRARGAHWREAAAPPSGWNDPSTWDGPRPPAAIGPDSGPSDLFAPPRSNGLESTKPKPKNADTKPKPTSTPNPVANVANPPPTAAVPSPAAATPTATASPPAAAASPAPAAPAAASAPPTPAASVEAAAKPEAPAVAKPPPPVAAKSKAVNDIPVTPLD